MKWVSYVITMSDNRILKALMHSQIYLGKRNIGWPLHRFKLKTNWKATLCQSTSHIRALSRWPDAVRSEELLDSMASMTLKLATINMWGKQVQVQKHHPHYHPTCLEILTFVSFVALSANHCQSWNVMSDINTWTNLIVGH